MDGATNWGTRLEGIGRVGGRGLGGMSGLGVCVCVCGGGGGGVEQAGVGGGVRGVERDVRPGSHDTGFCPAGCDVTQGGSGEI